MKVPKSSAKKVSWAPNANLRQEKLFLLKDCPSQVRLKPSGLSPKKPQTLHSDGLNTSQLPYGFIDGTCVNQLKKEVLHIPNIKWKCPPKFILNSKWLIASGEESQDVEAQKLREKHLVEAVYPHISAIPPCPYVSMDMEECHQDDCDIPPVPIEPMEDEGMDDTVFDLEAPVNTSMISKPTASSQTFLASGSPPTPHFNRPALDPPAIDKPVLGISSALQDDVVAAATVVITTFTKCKEQGSMIDKDLLVKILTNPKMTEKLINDRQAPEGIAPEPLSESKPVSELVPFRCSKPAIELEPRPASENMCYLPKRLQSAPDSTSSQEDSFPVSRSNQDEGSALNLSPLLPDTVQSLKSSPANVNMSTRLDDLLSAIKVRPPRLNTVLVSSPKSFSLQVPSSPSIEVDMVASQLKFADSLYPSCSGSQSSLSAMHCRQPLVPLSGFHGQSSVVEPRVLPPGPRDGNLHNIMKGVQPALNTRGKSDILPSSHFTAMKSHVKDANYYKTLIRLHGGERQGTHDQFINQYGNHRNYLQGPEQRQHINPIELKPRSVKSCIFFDSQTGCRFGANCHYQHDPFSKWRCGNMLEDNWTKRMKLDGKFTSRK